MKGWITLCADVNWQAYGGTWAKKQRGQSRVWWVLAFTNYDDCCSDHEVESMGFRYGCEVKRLDLAKIPGTEIRHALDCVGMSLDTALLNECELVWACVSYGLGAPMHFAKSMRRAERVRAEARREAERMMHDDAACAAALSRPVNAIGSTAEECGCGDFNAALNRAPRARVRRVKQRALSAECWLIQLWGKSACDTCEARGTDECGGKEILKTGVNENGYAVRKDGLDDVAPVQLA
jgi:hypothetical protein